VNAQLWLATRVAISSPSKDKPLMLAIGAGGGEFTRATMSQVSSVMLEGVGHYAALEAPEQVAHALLDFFRTVGAT
jgi:pimeloyl-ACP methyl ester carboxylesterase